MPKAKPDEVIVHRIELQQSEREMLEMAAGAYTFNKVMQPLVALINDNTTLVLILTTLAGWLGLKYIAPEITETYELITDFKEQYDAALEAGVLDPEVVAQRSVDSFGSTFFPFYNLFGRFWQSVGAIDPSRDFGGSGSSSSTPPSSGGAGGSGGGVGGGGGF